MMNDDGNSIKNLIKMLKSNGSGIRITSMTFW